MHKTSHQFRQIPFVGEIYLVFWRFWQWWLYFWYPACIFTEHHHDPSRLSVTAECRLHQERPGPDCHGHPTEHDGTGWAQHVRHGYVGTKSSHQGEISVLSLGFRAVSTSSKMFSGLIHCKCMRTPFIVRSRVSENDLVGPTELCDLERKFGASFPWMLIASPAVTDETSSRYSVFWFFSCRNQRGCTYWLTCRVFARVFKTEASAGSERSPYDSLSHSVV